MTRLAAGTAVAWLRRPVLPLAIFAALLAALALTVAPACDGMPVIQAGGMVTSMPMDVPHPAPGDSSAGQVADGVPVPVVPCPMLAAGAPSGHVQTCQPAPTVGAKLAVVAPAAADGSGYPMPIATVPHVGVPLLRHAASLHELSQLRL
ncbi:hypothetical protein [Dactylosporangium fulvum]|uniref:Uncharacterized protein n=1 Tax=Dactylosporangium fulvum TaxID=53359 RepID=A0ABY5VTW9_9ACTN|nr:hypothetical protein [Dactylosporangium fulvum]UWP80264.1 hypothetical protein Dfulv_34595 [Dactylosporangium fulvum]